MTEDYIDTEPCIHVCPECGHKCYLNRGHYVQHECDQGHKWW